MINVKATCKRTACLVLGDLGLFHHSASLCIDIADLKLCVGQLTKRRSVWYLTGILMLISVFTGQFT